jgi:hypothetical protein
MKCVDIDRCKHIRTVGKAEADLLKEDGSSVTSGEGEGGGGWQHPEEYQDNAINTISPSCTEFLNGIMALLASIAARRNSNGPNLCRHILNMMHDNLWVCWFSKDSQTNTAGWKRQGIFELQNEIFFGKSGELGNKFELLYC